jgi:hypothetical protein
MRDVQGPPPDLTAYVFCCPDCRWQIQASPKARSELGGHDELMRAIVEALSAHQTEHPDVTTTATGPDGRDANVAVPVPLPRWWVHR